MAFQKIPEGFVHPGYVVVSLYTGKDEPVVNVYGPFPSRAAANRDRKQTLKDSEMQYGADHQRDLSLFVRPIHDLAQLNRLLKEQESS